MGLGFRGLEAQRIIDVRVEGVFGLGFWGRCVDFRSYLGIAKCSKAFFKAGIALETLARHGDSPKHVRFGLPYQHEGRLGSLSNEIFYLVLSPKP